MVYINCTGQRMSAFCHFFVCVILFLLSQSMQLFYTFANCSHKLCSIKGSLSSTMSTCLLAINFYILKENSCKCLGTFEKENIILVKITELSKVVYRPIEVEFSSLLALLSMWETW